MALGGAAATLLSSKWASSFEPEHMVNLPRFASVGDVFAAIVTPDFSRLTDPAVWRVGVTLALVASLETLLCLEAIDRQDPRRRISPPNRELIAQGVGNLCSGLIGGIPITSVIVRSSANVQAGGQTRLATLTHGLLILLGVLFMAPLLNRVPLASLAVVLIFVGLKLTAPPLWRQMWKNGFGQFGPFALTVVAIVATDLLTGTLIGLVLGLLVSIRKQQQNAVSVEKNGDRLGITFNKDMTFLQKARLKDVLREIPDDTRVTIDRRVVDFVDDDIEELLREFSADAEARGLTVEILPASR